MEKEVESLHELIGLGDDVANNILALELAQSLGLVRELFSKYRGGLNLRHAENIVIPEGVHIVGYLDLDGALNITLPKSLSIGGELYLQGASNIALPKGISVYGDIYISRDSDIKIPCNLKHKVVYSD